MKKRHVLALAAVAALLGACIPSVNPFYSAKDVVPEPRLQGEWKEADKEDDPQIWKFQDAGDKSYRLTISEKANGKQGQFTARSFKLEQGLFLDLVPADCEYATNQADLVAASMFPGHLLVRVSEIEPKLKLAFFDFDWLQKHLEQNPKALAHHKEGERIVLTASTRELQRFVLRHLDKGGLFDEPGVMVRQTGTSAGQR